MTALSNKHAKQPSKSSVEPEHSKPDQPQFKSGVEPPHSAPSAQKQPLRCKYCSSTDIVKAGTRKLNGAVMKIFKEKAVTCLHLLFDKETHRIAFKPCSKATCASTGI